MLSLSKKKTKQHTQNTYYYGSESESPRRFHSDQIKLPLLIVPSYPLPQKKNNFPTGDKNYPSKTRATHPKDALQCVK